MAVAGTPVASWQDFALITGPQVLMGPEDFPNVSETRNYLTEHWLSQKTLLQGGDRIEEFPMTSIGSTAQNTLPGATRTIDDPNVMDRLTCEWRLTEDHMSINDLILGLQGRGSSADRLQIYKSLMTTKEVRLATSVCNKFESDFFAQPNATTMEGTTSEAVNPNPFWLYANEFGADGSTIFDTTVTDKQVPYGTGLPNGYTTIHGINPSTKPWYRPWQVGYSSTIDTTTVNPGAANFVTAMVKATKLINYKGRPWRGDNRQTNDAYKNPDYIIPTSLHGAALIHQFLVSANNYLRVDPQDPYYPNPSFAGIPIVECAGMSQAAVYPTSGYTAPAVGSGVTEDSASASRRGPRFPILSRKAIKWFMHSTYNFYFWDEKHPSRQWDTRIRPLSTMHNRIAVDRLRLAFVYPTTNITGYF